MVREKIADRYRALAPREKIAVISALLAVMLLLPYGYLYSPAASKLAQQREVLKNMKAEMEILNASVSTLQVPLQPDDKTSLPAAEDLAGMLSAITREANLANVDFISLVPESLTPGDRYVEMKLKIELKVRFRELHDFLYGLEKKQKLFLIKEIKFETNDAVYPSGVAVLRATAYVRKQ
jgi:type II secretory pathway component PulM